MAKFNEFQEVAKKAYAGGEFAYVTTMEEVEGVGDTLFLFIMREVATGEGCEDWMDVTFRLDTAIREMKEVIDEVIVNQDSN